MLEGVLGVNCSDLDFVNLRFLGSMRGMQGVWLIGTFVSWVWERIFVRGAPGLKKEEFFGFLKFKYKMAHELGTSIGVFPGFVL